MVMVWVFVTLCVVMAGVFIRQHYVGTPLSKLLTKGAASALFVTVGFLCVRLPSARPADYAPWMLTGLCLGMAGDIALACQDMFPKHKNQWFIAGLSLFAAGHLAYIVLFLSDASPGWFVVVVALCAVFLGLWLFSRWGIRLGKMAIPAYAYLLIISAMLGSAFGFFVAFPGLLGVMVLAAALSFYCSDAILAYMLFGPKRLHPLPAWNLATYYFAQLLLALSIGIP